MRARLTQAILLVVAGTLVLTAIGSLVLIRRSAYDSAEQQLYAQARVVASLAVAQPQPGAGVLSLTDTLRLVGGYDTLEVASLSPDGSFSGLPSSLEGKHLRTAQLQRDQSVAGASGSLAYVLIPLDLNRSQKQSLDPPVSANDTAVLVATRTVHSPVTGFGYFVVVSLVVLAAAAGVAYWLASRLSRPVVEAAEVTQRIAGGDLASRMPAADERIDEFRALSTSINAMADSLQRAQLQQRQFLLSVSHDLRTPLTSIRGYADAIDEGAADDVHHAARVIQAEAARLERLVGDLLDLARLDARRFSYEPRTVDVTDVIGRAVESFRPEAAGAGLELAASLPDVEHPVVLADPDRLSQILSNLLENASRYAASRVEVGARSDGPAVVLWVVDDGPGIPPADLPRVFEPHFSVDTSGPGDGTVSVTTHDVRRQGTGLGLAIVAELAAAMGGNVWAESPVTAAGGTRLSVRFPAAPVPAPR